MEEGKRGLYLLCSPTCGVLCRQFSYFLKKFKKNGEGEGGRLVVFAP